MDHPIGLFLNPTETDADIYADTLAGLFVGVLCLYLFCYAILCVHSSFAIILKRKNNLDVLLL